MSDDDTVDYADYCQTQAGLLAGQIERLESRADRLLDELDEETADVRDALGGDEQPTEAAFSEIEAKQETVIDLQGTIERYSEILDGYVDLAERLPSEDDPLAAVVRFELDEEAYACFDDRTTVAEQVAGIGRDQ